MSHIDRTIFDKSELLKFAQTGCGLEFDLFGIECSHYQVKGHTNILSPIFSYTYGNWSVLMDEKKLL